MGWGGGSDPKRRCLPCRQWKRRGNPSPVLSTFGRHWLGSAPSFSCRWSSPPPAATVSPRDPRGGALRSATAGCSARSRQLLRGDGVEISGTPSCIAGPGTTRFFLEMGLGESPFPLLFHSAGNFLNERQIPTYLSAAAARVFLPRRAERAHTFGLSTDSAGEVASAARGPGPWAQCPRRLGQMHHWLRFILGPLPMSPLPDFGSHAGEPQVYLQRVLCVFSLFFFFNLMRRGMEKKP